MRIEKIICFIIAWLCIPAVNSGLQAQDGFADVVLEDSPAAYYRFEEDAGAAVVEDASGNGHDSVAINNIILGAAGLVDGAAGFNGIDATIELGLQLNPANPRGEGPGGFSMELVFSTDTPLTLPQIILAQTDGIGLGRSGFLLTQTTGSIGSYLGGATTDSAIVPEANVWYHAVIVYDGTPFEEQLYIYVNGELAGTSVMGLRIAESADGNWVVGSHKNQSQSFFSGLIDEVAFYDYRLDDPDGDRDTSDSRIGAHARAAMEALTPCESITLACTTSMETPGMLDIEVTRTAEDCACTVADIAIDGIPAGTVALSPAGTAQVALPAECLPGEGYELELTCTLNGVSATCEFSCPCDPITMRCHVTEDETILAEFTQGGVDCECTVADFSIDGTHVSQQSIPVDGLVEIELPPDCEPGSSHVLEVTCVEGPELTLSWDFRCPGGGDAYAAVVMQDAPVAYYRFEEDAGADMVEDSSGNDHHSVFVNGAVLGGVGFLGNAAEFDGLSSIVVDFTMDPADPEGDGIGVGRDDWSMELFMNLEGLTGQPQTCLAQKDGTGLGRSALLGVTAIGTIGSFVGGATRSSQVTPEPGTWYHVVMTYDGGGGAETLRFYIDGELMATSAPIAESASGYWVIGSHKNEGMQWFTGMIDEVSFYDYRLDDPDGDDDTMDSRVFAHFDASGTPPPDCTSIELACTVVGDATLRAQVTRDPQGCACGEVEVFIDDVSTGTHQLPLDGVVVMPLPEDCPANSQHVLRVVCGDGGPSASCTFNCPGGGQGFFKRGDVNDDNKTDLADAISLLTYLFVNKDDPGISCLDAADGNDDGKLNLADAIRILSFLFGEDDAMPAPFPDCGADPTDEDPLVGCEYTNC